MNTKLVRLTILPGTLAQGQNIFTFYARLHLELKKNILGGGLACVACRHYCPNAISCGFSFACVCVWPAWSSLESSKWKCTSSFLLLASCTLASRALCWHFWKLVACVQLYSRQNVGSFHCFHVAIPATIAYCWCTLQYEGRVDMSRFLIWQTVFFHNHVAL